MARDFHSSGNCICSTDSTDQVLGLIPTPHNCWSYAFTADLIANGLIALLGITFSFPPNSLEEPAVAAVGCTYTANVMACTPEADWKDIRAAAAAVKLASSSVFRSILSFCPTPDGELVFSHPEAVLYRSVTPRNRGTRFLTI